MAQAQMWRWGAFRTRDIVAHAARAIASHARLRHAQRCGEIEPAVVQRAAGDDAFDAVAAWSARTWMSAMPFTPPLAITGMSTARARSTVASTLQPLSSPSRPTSVNSSAATPASSKRRARSTTLVRRTRRPSPWSRPCRRARRPRRRCRRESRAPRRGRTRDPRARRCRSRRATRRDRTSARSLRAVRMPPPSWTWPGKRSTIAAHRIAVDRLAREGAVEIDDVEMLRARLRRTASPARRDRRHRRWRGPYRPRRGGRPGRP